MKKFASVLVFVFAVSAFCQTPPLGTDHTIAAQWNAPVANAQNQGPCSATVKTNCLIGYTETITPPAGVPGGNNVIPACGFPPLATNCISSTDTSHLWTPQPGPLYCGVWTISLVANYADGTGSTTAADSVSTPISTTVTEPCPFVANPPVNINVQVTP